MELFRDDKKRARRNALDKCGGQLLGWHDSLASMACVELLSKSLLQIRSIGGFFGLNVYSVSQFSLTAGKDNFNIYIYDFDETSKSDTKDEGD